MPERRAPTRKRRPRPRRKRGTPVVIPAKQAEILVASTDQVAGVCNITPSAMRNWKRRPDWPQIGTRGPYDLAVLVPWYLRHVYRPPTPPADNSPVLAERARRVRLMGDLTELEIRHRMGQLVKLDQVRSSWNWYANRMKTAIDTACRQRPEIARAIHTELKSAERDFQREYGDTA